MKCKYEGIDVLVGRCMGTKEIDPCIGYDRCSRFKEDYISKGDRIRAMSDEELAWELMCWRVDAYSKAVSDECIYPDTQKTVCDWLKQPAKEV